jgi:hypothetical protein
VFKKKKEGVVDLGSMEWRERERMSVVLLFYKLLGAWLQLASERERERRGGMFLSTP